MDGLSATASVFAVTSLAIQLADSIRKLHEFWQSISDASEDIHRITTDLKLLSSVLVEIAIEGQQVDPDAALPAVLHECFTEVANLHTIIDKIEPGLGSSNLAKHKWAAFKGAMKMEKLKKFQQALERLKSTLILVQQNQHGRLNRARHQLQQQTLTAITKEMSCLSTQHSSILSSRLASAPPNVQEVAETGCAEMYCGEWQPGESDVDFGSRKGSAAIHTVIPNQDRCDTLTATDLRCPQYDQVSLRDDRRALKTHLWTKEPLSFNTSRLGFLFGNISVKSTTKRLRRNKTDERTLEYGQEQSEHETTVIIHPAAWLIQLGIKYGLHVQLLNSSLRGWKSRLDSIHLVPDNAAIFKFCITGNEDAVRTLLESGYASIRDSDSKGWTPLHYAARNHHPELCRLLIDAGADKGSRTDFDGGPLLIAVVRNPGTNKTLPRVLDTLRLFIEGFNFSDAKDDDGWSALIRIVDHNTSLNGEREAKFMLLDWMVRLFSEDVKRSFIDTEYACILKLTGFGRLRDVMTLLLSLGPDKAIDIRHPGGYSLLLHANAYGARHAHKLVSYGPDLHLSGMDSSFSPRLETATSLAMYSSWSFWAWRDALLCRQIDMATFIGDEIDKGPLIEYGWEHDTLQTLFSWDFEPDVVFEEDYHCDDCSTLEIGKIGCRVQPFWMYLLEMIRQKIYRYVSHEPESEAEDHSWKFVSHILEAHNATGMIDANDPSPGPVPNEYVSTTSLNDFSAESETLEPENAIPVTEIGTSNNRSQKARLCIYCWLDLHWANDEYRFSQDDTGIEPETNTLTGVTEIDTPVSEPHILEDKTDVPIKSTKRNKMEDSHNDDAASPRRRMPCPYKRHEIVCMDCWLYYQDTGTRRRTSIAKENQSATDSDSLSEQDYSPFSFSS